MNKTSFAGFLILLGAGTCLTIPLGGVWRNSAFAEPAVSTNPSSPAIALTREYIRGMEAGKLDALNALFLPNGRSWVLENASDEGSWEHYRDHHLAPELKEAPDFKFTIEKEAEDRFGPTSIVRQVGRFVVKVGEESKPYRAAVTYVVVEDGGSLKIVHLHWSSRPDRK